MEVDLALGTQKENIERNTLRIIIFNWTMNSAVF